MFIRPLKDINEVLVCMQCYCTYLCFDRTGCEASLLKPFGTQEGRDFLVTPLFLKRKMTLIMNATK
jgi:hypothetical protein